MSSTPAARRQDHGTPPDDSGVDLVELGSRVLHSGWLWVVLWLLSRALMLRTWGLHHRFIGNDVRYYFVQLTQGGEANLVLREYPQPVLWFLRLLLGPSANDISLYLVVFALTMALLDAGFAYWLWRAHSQVAAIYWMAFCFAMGPLVWFRYDMLPGVVVGAAVLVLARRPGLSGALVALGAGIKLWPALLVAPLLGRDRPARARTIGFGLTGLALALVALLDAGFTRLVSPLTWQSGRGLQIESIWATPLMWLRAFGTDPSWQVEMSRYNAFELFGPGVDGLQRASSVAMALGICFALAVGFGVLRRPRTGTSEGLAAHQRALACAAIVTVMLVANKTLSPQYLVWLGAVTAAWLAVTPRGQRRRPVIACLLCLGLAGATQYIYPVAYNGLIGNPTGEPTVTLVLTARNMGLVVLCLAQVWWVLADLFGPAAHKVGRVGPGPESTDSIAVR